MFKRTRSFLRRLTGAESATSTVDDRRLYDRVPADHETIVQLNVDDAEPFVGRIEDVSPAGMKLVVERFIEPGTMIRVDIPTSSGEARTRVLACIVHVQAAAQEGYELGCSFATELSAEDLASFGVEDGRAVEFRPERPRNVERARALYRRVGCAEYEPAGIHNISVNGVALRLHEDLPPGALLDLELHGASGTAALTIVGCVVYVTALGHGRWLTGCNFVRELDDDDLRDLLATDE